MRNREYWQKRSLEDKKRSVNLTENFINRQLKRSYKDALTEVQAALNQMYQAFAKSEGITLQEAKKRLTGKELRTADLDAIYLMVVENRKQLKEKLDRLPGDIVAVMEQRLERFEKQLKRLSQKGYLTHLELTEAQLQSSILKLADRNQINMYEFMEEQYRDGYFRQVFETQKGLGFGVDFTAPDDAAVRKAVMKSWCKSHYSEKIWGQEKRLGEELRDALTVGLIRGDGVEEMTKRLTRRMEVSASNARRLVRTEAAYIHEQSELDAYEECGITEYQFLATLDRRTSIRCRELDGKVFSIKDAEVGINYPPIHPNCRSTTVPQAGTEATRRIARGANGKTYKVTGNTTYEEWYRDLSKEEKGLMSLKNRKDRNVRADREQFERYQKVLGERAGSQAEFLKMKYEDAAKYEHLQKIYKEQKYIDKHLENLKNGLVNTNIQRKKQEEHTQGTKALRNRLKQALATQGQQKEITPQSFLYRDIDAQKLVQDYAGTGITVYNLGSNAVKEFVTVDKPVGRYYNKGKHRYVETSRICIMFTNKGTHVFPVKELNND